ncbi:MAG: HAD-IC family P-type ATPase [Polyangiaceae bacterium]|nr:HAD-IC family P-type ATPase [Polyangiaceae bacterium]
MAAVSERSTSTPQLWYALPPDRALDLLTSSEAGLSSDEAATRLEQFGPNVLERAKGVSPLTLLWRQLNSPIVFLLLGSSALAAVLGKMIDAAVVLGAVVVNTIIGFLQEFRAAKAIEALSGMVPQQAQVVRDGRLTTASASSLVPGDIVSMSSGDRVPADVRLLSSRNLQVEEAALTGESVPAEKTTAAVSEDATIGDRRSMAYNGTLVTAGTATALVVATGKATELGRISNMLEEASELQTPLTKAMATVGKWLTVAVLAISFILAGVSLARGYSVADAVLVAVTLAVAAIPEGLPAIITIALAIGVQRMAARRAVVRKLPSVETLGSTTVICSDKTGTLTRNEMTVLTIATPKCRYTFSGVGYEPTGELTISDGEREEDLEGANQLLIAAALCNDASVQQQNGQWQLTGDPTEGALVVAAMKAGHDVHALRTDWRRLDAIPFESEHQFMASLHAMPDGTVVAFMKGAPEVVVSRCDIASDRASEITRQVTTLASGGMRILAVSQKVFARDATSLEPRDVESGFELLGLQGMIDPPRPEAIAAVKACHAAGITVKMITGDHLETAAAIGRELGLVRDDQRGMSGHELAKLDPTQMRRAARTTNVFARVAPEHKLGLVKALQEEGHVVAMTGDGVNDAPSLKQANVGVAMGITGTAVSKEAADIVLTDDNFASIAAAVEEGRRVYDNLLKSLAFVLPTNLALGLVLIAAVAFFPVLEIGGKLVPLMPMLPTQILWVNLVASVALSLPLAFEVKEPDTMSRPPRDPKTPILGRFVLRRTSLVAFLMAVGAIGLFLWEYYQELPRSGHEFALREAQTMAVTTIIFAQIFYLLQCRSLRGSLLRLGIFSNWTIFAGIAAIVVLQAGFVYIPFMQRVFGTAPLSLHAIAFSALVGSVILPVIGLEKAIRNRFRADVPTRRLAHQAR